MDQVPDERSAATNQAPKYATPTLVDYGDLVELTSGANKSAAPDGTMQHTFSTPASAG